MDSPTNPPSSSNNDSNSVVSAGLGLALAMWICDLVAMFGLAVLDATSSINIGVGAWIGLGVACVVVQLAFLIAIVVLAKHNP
jgi:hypothetical protein